MSISLTLYRNDSDTNVVNKSITSLLAVTGTLKERTSILNPSILVQGTLPTTCNYFYISEFGRYYYIDDVVSVTNDTFQITGHVDVLQTYATEIRASTGIIARQENAWNLYVDDGAFKVYQNPKFRIDLFPSGFSSLNFILAVAGNS